MQSCDSDGWRCVKCGKKGTMHHLIFKHSWQQICKRQRSHAVSWSPELVKLPRDLQSTGMRWNSLFHPGTRFSIRSMVLSFWSAPSSLEIPALRVPRYRLAPVDCFFWLLGHRQSSLLAFRSSYPRLPRILMPPTFATTASANFLICWFAIFGLNDNVVLFCLNSVASKCGSWYADCRALRRGPSSQEDRTLAAWSKKTARRREGAGDVSCEGPISSWMCCIDQKNVGNAEINTPAVKSWNAKCFF